jgi:hypothetical protein
LKALKPAVRLECIRQLGDKFTELTTDELLLMLSYFPEASSDNHPAIVGFKEAVCEAQQTKIPVKDMTHLFDRAAAVHIELTEQPEAPDLTIRAPQVPRR